MTVLAIGLILLAIVAPRLYFPNAPKLSAWVRVGLAALGVAFSITGIILLTIQ